MEPDRWRRLQQLFDEASRLESDARLAFLDRECAGDPELRGQVESLLLHDGADAASLSGVIQDVLTPLREHDARPEGRIGSYRILRAIGRGGMGEVLLAVRDDDEYEKQVAIKLIRVGLDSPALRERFRRERQILATLEHPSIAHLLDGGTTDSGDPYVVMEYVEGDPIDAYCDAHRLSIEDRLRLFQQVCAAVQYAHSNLIVHRDIKPANILVTSDGSVKLLDFGIAKLLHPELMPQGMAETRTMMRLLTPDYASPEQVRGDPITTATDVYSLGVLLYELLTGSRPFRLDTTRPGELEQVICERQPEHPSTAVTPHPGAADGAPQAQAVSQARKTDPQRLRRRLSGDIDNIVLMALRKEPSRRYASAAQLAEDIDRHLRGEPVQARPATLGYRLQKFLSRNRREAAFVAMAVVLLAGLVGFYTYRLTRERDAAAAQRDIADRERLKAEQVSHFLTGMFEQANPYLTGGAELTARQILDQGARQIQSELLDEPDVRTEVMRTIARVDMGLGLYEEARSLRQDALATLEELHGADDGALVPAIRELAYTLYKLGDFEASEQQFARALELLEREAPEDLRQRAFLLNDYGLLQRELGRRERCQEMFREALAIAEEVMGPDDREVANTLLNYGVQLDLDREFDEAEPIFRRALEIMEKNYGPEDIRVAAYVNNLAKHYINAGDFEAAKPLAERNVALRERTLEPDHPALTTAYTNLAKVLENTGDRDGADVYYRRAIRILEKQHGPESPQLSQTLNSYGILLAKEGDETAVQTFRASLAMKEKFYGPDHPSVAHTLGSLGEFYLQTNRPGEALPLVQRAAVLWEKQYGPDHVRTALGLSRLARAQAELGMLEEARVGLERVVEIYGNDPGERAALIRALGRLAGVLDAQGDAAAAACTRARIAELDDADGTSSGR